MDARVIIVPPGSAALHDPTTERLHTYANGDVLVRTRMVTAEAAGATETPVDQGLQVNRVARPPADAAALAPDAVAVSDASRVELAYVALIGPVDSRWLEALRQAGVEPLRFHPHNSFLCRGTVTAFRSAREQPFVLDVTPLSDTVKTQLAIAEAPGVTEAVWIAVQGTRDEAPAIVRDLDALPDVAIDRSVEVEEFDHVLRIPAQVTSEGQSSLLNHPRVLAIEPYARPVPEDEVAGLIIAGQYDAAGRPSGSYLRWLEDHGLNGVGVTIGVVDNGLDVSHAAFGRRIRDLAGGKKAWHGTFVAGHAAGCSLDEKDGKKFIYGLGTAPAADVLAQDNQRTPAALCKETVTEAGPSGAFGSVQNNSWGAGLQQPMTYGSQEAAYDKLVRNADPEGSRPKPLTVCFSSGNSGANGLTRPKGAKNVIVTGNSENFRPDVGLTESDNINHVHTGSHASSHGNCADGRIRPHVVAPGEWTASANFDSRAGQKEFISAKHTWGGGSSGASPKTAGACALLIQWWRRHNNGVDPSPALLRALIVNGAEPMNFLGPIPNRYEGWGRLSLKGILSEDVHHTYLDQSALLAERGQAKQWRIRVSDPKKPVKITLAWTDPPAAIGTGTAAAPAVVNKLALRVEVNGRRYRANQFVKGWSQADNPAEKTAEKEGWDNLQNVYLQAGEATDTLRVTVTALDLTTNCLTGQIDRPQQDFALVITNGHLDGGFTPADVFLVLDPATNAGINAGINASLIASTAGGPLPRTGPGARQAVSDSGDADDLSADWWESTMDAAGEVAGSDQADAAADGALWSGAAADVDAWWAAGDEPLTPPVGLGLGSGGALPAPVPVADPTAELRTSAAVRAAIDLVSLRAGHRVVTAGCLLADAAATVDAAGGVDTGDAEGAAAVRRRAAVVVVGAGTRFARPELDLLRELAFTGELYLISDNPVVLATLAQRIHLRRGVHYRLAGAEGLAAQVPLTLLEASGAQQIETTTTYKETPGAVVSRHAFGVVAADRHVAIHVPVPADEVAPQLLLQRPGQSHPVTLAVDRPGASGGPETINEGTRVSQRPDGLQIDLSSAGAPNWAGEWRLTLKRVPRATAPSLPTIWAWGGLGLHLREQLHEQDGPDSEAGAGNGLAFVALEGAPGVTFTRCQIEQRAIGSDPTVPLAEAERPIEIAVEPSRLDFQDAAPSTLGASQPETSTTAPSAPAPASAPSVGAWIPAPAAAAGA
ncbi:MAG: S8 family serine peptidase, partial [Chloroflexota bacterium]|nr:S8 family serine peptidase [Chloroflexota bacterium]